MPFIHRAGGCDVADANSYTETIPTLAGGGVLVISTAARGASVNSPLPILTLGSATFTVAQTFVPLSTRTRHTVFYSTDYAAGTSVSLGVSMSGNLQAGLFWSVEEQLGGTGTLVQSNQTQTPSATLLGTTLAPGSGEMVVSAHTASVSERGDKHHRLRHPAPRVDQLQLTHRRPPQLLGCGAHRPPRHMAGGGVGQHHRPRVHCPATTGGHPG